MTAQEVLAQSDVEVRRAGCEIMGWGKILADLPHKAIDADADPEIGTLIHVDLPDAPGSAFLIVRCGTGRDGIPLPVPATCETAIEANAWTYSVPRDRAHILRQRQVRT